MLRLVVQTEGVTRYIETLANSAADLKAPLAAWNEYKRKEVQGRFDAGGPGWPERKNEPPAHSTSEAVKQFADEMLRKKLKNELRRAQRKYARLRGSAESVARRYKVLQEFERIAAGGSPIDGKSADAKLDKSVRGLRARHERATAKAEGRPLGRIASSIKSKLSSSSVEIFSEISWSGVHNEGGEVGRGAVVPERRFLEVTDEDVKALKMLIEEHLRFSL